MEISDKSPTTQLLNWRMWAVNRWILFGIIILQAICSIVYLKNTFLKGFELKTFILQIFSVLIVITNVINCIIDSLVLRTVAAQLCIVSLQIFMVVALINKPVSKLKLETLSLYGYIFISAIITVIYIIMNDPEQYGYWTTLVAINLLTLFIMIRKFIDSSNINLMITLIFWISYLVLVLVKDQLLVFNMLEQIIIVDMIQNLLCCCILIFVVPNNETHDVGILYGTFQE